MNQYDKRKKIENYQEVKKLIRGVEKVKRRFNLYKTGAPERENRDAEKITAENIPELMKKHKS